MNNSLFQRIDWVTLLIYLSLVIFGMFNIYSTSYEEGHTGFLDLNIPIGKQVLFFGGCLLLAIPILASKATFFEQFSYLIYFVSLLTLLGLFLFGKTISGATSWYVLGGISIQPSEFAKITTALVLGALLTSIQANLKNWGFTLKSILLILLPVVLIILQPDPGSVVVFAGFAFVLFREGLTMKLLYFSVGLLVLFLFTLLFDPYRISIAILLLAILVFFLLNKSNFKIRIVSFLFPLLVAIGFTFSVDFIFNSIFEQRHRDRFNIILGIESDTQGVGYNTNQSKIAIGSGGLTGKGFLKGTQTKGKFVPEQHTDYIFSTIGEEWGFLGSAFVILMMGFLIYRIIASAEKQHHQFRRIFSYSFASLLFMHFFVNIGMTLGLVPTVGIPLPFISYGGSNLVAFSIFMFIHLNFDANRLSD